MTTHRTPSTVRAAHTALPPSGRNRSSMKPSHRVRSDVPATGPGKLDSVTRSSSRQDSSTKWVTRMSPGKPTREGGDKSGAKLIRTVLNYELTTRCYTTVRWPRTRAFECRHHGFREDLRRTAEEPSDDPYGQERPCPLPHL